MKFKKIKVVLFLIFSLSFFAFIPAKTTKAQAIGIKISPTKTEEMVNPGDVLNEKIKVTNESNSAKTFFVYLRDFKAAGETGIANLIAPGSEPGPYLSSWINITDQGLELAPSEEKTIDFTINVPKNAGPGGYYGAVVFGTEPPKINVTGEERGAAMSIAQQAASLILLRVSGDIIEVADIREFTTDKRIYSLPFEIKFLTRIENTGNVHVKPRGEIFIKNMLGQEVTKIYFNDVGANVLPGTIRRFEDSWPGTRGLGKYQAALILSFGTSAEQGGQGKQTLYLENTFWILPWKIIIPTVLALTLLIILISLLLKFYKNKAVKKAMRQMGIRQTGYASRQYRPSLKLHLALIISVFLLLIFLISVIIYFIFFA